MVTGNEEFFEVAAVTGHYAGMKFRVEWKDSWMTPFVLDRRYPGIINGDPEAAGVIIRGERGPFGALRIRRKPTKEPLAELVRFAPLVLKRYLHSCDGGDSHIQFCLKALKKGLTQTHISRCNERRRQRRIRASAAVASSTAAAQSTPLHQANRIRR